MNSSRTSVKRRFKDNTNTDKTHFHLLSIFPFVRTHRDFLSLSPSLTLCLCVCCHDVSCVNFIAKRVAITRCHCFLLALISRLCFVIVKPNEWYVHLHQNNLNTSCVWTTGHRERMAGEKKMFGILVWCLLSPLDWKRYRRQSSESKQVTWDHWICALFRSSPFVACRSFAHSHHTNDECDDDENDKSIEKEQNSMKKKNGRSDYSVCDLKYTFFSYLSSSTRAIWQYFWIQFDRLSCNMTCNIFLCVYVMLLPWL